MDTIKLVEDFLKCEEKVDGINKKQLALLMESYYNNSYEKFIVKEKIRKMLKDVYYNVLSVVERMDSNATIENKKDRKKIFYNKIREVERATKKTNNVQ